MPNLTFAVPKKYKIIIPIIDAGDSHILTIKGNITYGWGNNGNGQIGDNTITTRCTPVTVYGSKTFCKISAGINYSLSIDKNGKGWGWGLTTGRLGDNTAGTPASRITPVAICGNKTFCHISAGSNHSLGIDNNGKGWSWGNNGQGRLGDNTTTQRLTPIAICGNKTFCKISAGGSTLVGFSLAIDKNGKGWSWGNNTSGILGDNTITSRLTPVAICGNKTFCEISAGQAAHSLAIDKNGKGWGWGNNASGRIGDNTITSRLTPVAICGNKTFCKISAGAGHSLAIDQNGKGWAWGNNSTGMLGDNTLIGKQTPIAICGNKTFCEISAGNSYSIAVDYKGLVWAWGTNANGQLGDNTTTSKLTPIRVCTF